MPSDIPDNRVLRFGVFELDPTTGELRKNGRPVNLQPQPARVLAILASRPGELVSRDELQRELWGEETFVDFEHGVNFCVSRIRAALGDDAESPRFVETLPRRGYRFMAPVQRLSMAAPKDAATPRPAPIEFVTAATAPSGETPPPARGEGGRALSLAPVAIPPPPRPGLVAFPVPKQPARQSRIQPILAVASALVVVGAGIYLLRPAAAPRLLRTSQLTHFGRAAAERGAATDGVRIYFSEVNGGHYTVDQVSVAGGEPTTIPLPFPNAEVFDISPDRTELLVASFAGLGAEESLWVVPAVGGSPRRLGDAAGSSAAWSPDSQTIAYTRNSDLYLISKDGTASRRLLQMPREGELTRVRWSPSGRALRFTLSSGQGSQWQVSADGSDLHPLPRRPHADPAESEDLGSWTADGRYFLYRSVGPQGVPSIWTTRDTDGLFQPFQRKRVELYEGPQWFFAPLASADGKKVFFVGDQERRELVRYDAASRQFVPYLGGIFARWLEFSRDGQWVTYNFSPGFTLWISRPDGSERRQLSFPPMAAFDAYLSPDGRQIAANTVAAHQGGIYLLPTEAGGKPEQVTFDSAAGAVVGWCGNGSSLCIWRAFRPGASAQFALYLLDLKTRQTSLLPGSEGLHHGSVSPDGLHVAALTENNRSVVLYDLQTHRQTELARGAGLIYPCWSHDGKAVYFQDVFQAPDQPIYRVRIDDRSVERVTSFAQPFAADVTGYRLTGVTPNEQVLAALIRSNSDLYALDVDFPQAALPSCSCGKALPFRHGGNQVTPIYATQH